MLDDLLGRLGRLARVFAPSRPSPQPAGGLAVLFLETQRLRLLARGLGGGEGVDRVREVAEKRSGLGVDLVALEGGEMYMLGCGGGVSSGGA